MALKSSREGLRKELVDYLGNIIIDDNLRNEIIKVVGNNFVTSENLNEAVNNLTMQITTESGERIEADDTLQNNITAEAISREQADTTLQNNINAETTARQEAISNLEELIGASGLQMDLLWTNASPTSEFVPQTISLDLSNYKFVYIECKRQKDNSFFGLNGLIRVGSSNIGCLSVKYSATVVFRFIEEVSEQSVIFGPGATIDSDDNSYGIPLFIYGVA